QVLTQYSLPTTSSRLRASGARSARDGWLRGRPFSPRVWPLSCLADTRDGKRTFPDRRVSICGASANCGGGSNCKARPIQERVCPCGRDSSPIHPDPWEQSLASCRPTSVAADRHRRFQCRRGVREFRASTTSPERICSAEPAAKGLKQPPQFLSDSS